MKQTRNHAIAFLIPWLWCLFILAGLTESAAPQTVSANDQSLLGFTRERAREQRALEARFDALLDRDNLRTWMKRMTARPHHLGSPFGKECAEFLATQFRAWGYETKLEEFEVLFPTPKLRLLEMIEPGKFTAALREPPLLEDSTSALANEQLPIYNVYSIDGEVTGPLVYVNYGLPKDYELLAEKGIDVQGKIVITRYGGAWRGIKPKVAAEHGAIGCIIYSDPRDDGFFQGDDYPRGAFRNSHGAQRGSVADMPVFAGDPLTPGVGATKDAKRLPLKEASALTKIPVLPIAYADALPLLQALGGPVAPEDWRGALPLTYHLGPGPARVHLHLEFNWEMATAYDVIATLPGAERPDQWIIRGNHHDAWVFGADDPVSGLVAMMEEARAMGELARGGWHPKRTIIFAAWDGEEPGLLGSTEWVETHAELLKSHAAVYLNGDNSGRGFLRANGSHTLEKFINEIARDVLDPQKKITVADRLRAYQIVKGSPEDRREARERSDFRIGALGSGSDYSPFLQHLGIASADLRYSGENGGGSYHSVYDSFDHYTRFGDPNFDYGIALAETSGRAVLRFANADVLPFEFTGLAETLEKYVKEIIKLADDLREETKEKNRRLSEKTLEAVADPTQIYVLPKPDAPVPFVNFAPLQNALAKLQDSARSYERARSELAAGKRSLSQDTQKALDKILMQSERALIRNEGLPRRPWYRHQVYAPGYYTGYGVKTLPGVREAIEQRNWKETVEQVDLVAKTLEQFSEVVDRAAAMGLGKN